MSLLSFLGMLNCASRLMIIRKLIFLFAKKNFKSITIHANENENENEEKKKMLYTFYLILLKIFILAKELQIHMLPVNKF